MRKLPFALAAFLVLGNAHALKFNFTSPTGTIDPAALAGFKQAGDIWAGIFSDDVTINVNVGYRNLGDASVIGQTQSTQSTFSYSGYRTNLVADKSSAVDTSATASLAAGSSYSYVINGTSTSGASSTTLGTSHLATATNVLLTRANAKAVGLVSATDAAVDATIEFNSVFAFDLDRSNGIAANQMDFVGVAAHEIGHALGFTSGVDTLDYNFALNYYNGTGLPSDAAFANSHTSLDLFRYANYGTASAPNPLRDWTLGNYATAPFTYVPYTSFDGGKAQSGAMSGGTYFGDGNQASHWLDDGISGKLLGIMDPNTDFGNLMLVSQNDINAFDAIGWNVRPVPEPASFVALGVGALALLRRRRSR